MVRLLGILLLLLGASGAAGKERLINASSGFYGEPVALVAEAELPGAVVRYTVDGALPTVQSPELAKNPVLITNTTVIRAAAFQNGKRVRQVETRTLIFPADVVRQTGKGFPSTWGSKEGRSIVADYEMDPEIASGPEEQRRIIEGLKALPTLSIVMSSADLFGAEQGIYAHPEETGNEWERACSVEFIAEGKSRFEVGSGIRIQGGWNRRPEESPKHAFRLVFKKKYGPGKLHYALFGENAPGEFDTLILRAGCNNSWLHWSGVERRRGEFIRDQWMRDTYREMGQLSAAGMFVHLYLNGLYWGLYNIAERPDESFAASHLGGEPGKYDSFNAAKLLSGTREAWTELMRRVNSGVKTRAEFDSVGEMLDLQNFADYMILNLYGANADWDRHSNWYAARRREPPGKFKFFVWDAERTLENPNDSTIEFDDDESPPRIFHQLSESADFRRLFADRVKLHLLGNGVLTPGRCAERYQKWVNKIDQAVEAESARWGDYRRDVHPYKEGPYEIYTRQGTWLPEVKRLLVEYFPNRTAIVLRQFEASGLKD